MLSEKYSKVELINNQTPARLLRITLYILVMTGLLIYGKISYPVITLDMCFNEPARYDGITLSLGAAITVREIFADGFSIHQFGRIVKVKGDASGLAPGDYISIIAVFHKEGWLDLVDSHVARGRRYKILVSLLPAVLVLIFFCTSFTFDRNYYAFREKT